MTTIQYIDDFHQAEVNAERVMKSWGFTDAKATTGGADGGIDVRSSRALAQVKWKGATTGAPDIQRLYGARGLDHDKQLFFFSASRYSKAAIDYADRVGIRLFIYDRLGNVEPANRPAREFRGVERRALLSVLLVGTGGLWALLVVGGICAGLFVVFVALTG